MKSGFIVITLIILLTSCNKDTDGRSEEYTFTDRSTIVLDDQQNFSFARVEVGENLVFKYYFEKDDIAEIADDEYSESILFEINPTLSSFTFSDIALENIQAYFDKSCFCGVVGSVPIVKGSISGEKIDDRSWDIDIDVSFEDNGVEVFKRINGSFVRE